MDVSIVVPVYNENQNLALLHRAIVDVMKQHDWSFEVIYVNDGSTDGSDDELDRLADRDFHVSVLHLKRNFGQTAAMSAGLANADGDCVVTIDADLQNDPADIPAMIEKLNDGFDLVHGWRRKRQDKFWTRCAPSKIANWLISKVTGFPVQDLGCTLKVMTKQTADDLNLYGEMHRFIPILAHWQGARCVEVETAHHPRRFGQTKYGLSRTFRVILDLITVKYLIQYSTSPMRLFGSVGFLCSMMGLVCFAAVLGMKGLMSFDMSGNPLLYLSLFGWMIGLQFFSLGMLGEMNARIYYESQGRKPYSIRRAVGRNLRPQRQRAAA